MYVWIEQESLKVYGDYLDLDLYGGRGFSEEECAREGDGEVWDISAANVEYIRQ